MTAPLGNSGRDATAPTDSSQSSEQDAQCGRRASTNNGDGDASSQSTGRPATALNGAEHPELDDFVNGFYDGMLNHLAVPFHRIDIHPFAGARACMHVNCFSLARFVLFFFVLSCSLTSVTVIFCHVISFSFF